MMARHARGWPHGAVPLLLSDTPAGAETDRFLTLRSDHALGLDNATNRNITTNNAKSVKVSLCQSSGRDMRRPDELGPLWFLLSFALLFLIAGCNAERVPPRLAYFSPAVMLVPTDESLRIRIVYELNDYNAVAFEWSAEAGEVESDGGAAITYTAPSEPGQYVINVTASYGEADDAGQSELRGFVRVVPGPTWVAPENDGDLAAAQASSATSNAVETDTTEIADEGSTSGSTSDQPVAQGETTEAQAEGIDSRLDRILADDRLTAVVQSDFPPFSFVHDSGERVGFDVDLVREFARRWLDDASAIDLLPVASPQRIPTLLAGDADLVAAALTRTAERDEQVDFSLTYFKDGQRLLVTEGAEITSVCDLEGEPVAAIAETTSLENYLAAASECGFDGNESVVAFDDHEDAVAALVSGDVAAFTGDGVALERFAEGGALEVVGNHFSEEPYVVAVAEGDRRLQELVDATLLAMEDDGTFAAIYEQWFGDSIAPYTLEEAVIDTDLSELEPLLSSDAPPFVEAASETREVPEEYVVERGDSLSVIAGKLFGDVGPNSWQRLYEANRDVIGDDPSRLEVGMVLTVPR